MIRKAVRDTLWVWKLVGFLYLSLALIVVFYPVVWITRLIYWIDGRVPWEIQRRYDAALDPIVRRLVSWIGATIANDINDAIPVVEDAELNH